MSFVNKYRSTTIYGELKVQKYNTGNIAGLLDVSGNTILRGDCTINGNLSATDGTIDISGNLNVSDTISGKLAINDTNNTNDFFRVPFLDNETSSSTLSSSAGLRYNPVSEYVNYTTLDGGDIFALDISCNNVNANNLAVSDTISGKLAINDENNTNDFFRVPFLDSETSSSTLSSSAGLQYNPVSEQVNYTTLNGGDIYALDISCNNVNAANFIGNVSTATDDTDASFYPTFVSAEGNVPLKVNSGITYNPSTETLNVTNINGTITNNSTTSTIATDATNASFYPTFVSATSGNLGLKVDAGITYNPSTNILSCNVNGASTKVAITPDATNADLYIPFVTATSGNRELLSDLGLRFNPSANMLTVDNATIANMTGTSSQVLITNTTADTSYRVPFSLVSTGNCPLGSDGGITYNPNSNLLNTTVSKVNVTNTTSGTYRVPFALTTTGSVALGSDEGLTYDASANLLTTTASSVVAAVAGVGLFPIALATADTGSSSIKTDGGNFYYNSLTKVLLVGELQADYMRTPLSGVWLFNGNNTNSVASLVPLFCSQTDLGNINDQSALTLEAASGATAVGSFVNPFDVDNTTDLIVIMPKWGIRAFANTGYASTTRINVHNQYEVPIYVTPTETNSISSCRIYYNHIQITGPGS